jgi:hypothetical protein
MIVDKDGAHRQIFRLAYIARNIAFYRALAKYKGTFAQNFWIYAFNNYFDMAVLEWCKVFGSRGEPTHWSAVVQDADSFRAALLAELKLSRDEWRGYWEQMKNYRDLAVVHHMQDPRVTSYPTLDIALQATSFYYKFLVCALRDLPEEPMYFLPKNLESYYQRLLQHAEQVATAAYEASRGIEDKVR